MQSGAVPNEFAEHSIHPVAIVINPGLQKRHESAASHVAQLAIQAKH